MNPYKGSPPLVVDLRRAPDDSHMRHALWRLRFPLA